MKSTTFHTKSATFHENKQDQVNMCVYIYHQISPKYNIYLVGLPSVLYERPGQNERPMLNQLFLLLFRFFQCFSHTFYEKCHFSYKKWQFLWKQTKLSQYVCIHAPFTHTCTTCTTKHHQNIRYTWLAFSLYSMKDQVKMRDLCWISCFCYFSGAFQCFSCTFNEKCHSSWKQTKPGQYVCIHAPFTHTCTTKYHQNIIYT